MLYWIGYYLFHVFRFLWFPCKIRGKENIPLEGGCIFASNHNSNLDPFLIGIIPKREVYFFAKKELFKNRFVGWLMRQWHAFPADRNRADIGALKIAIAYLRNGHPLVFFPEGTRGGIKNQGKVFPGVGFLASKANVPIIPVHLKGSDVCMPPGSKFPKRHWITVSFDKPIFPSDFSSYEEISAAVMQRILVLSSE